MTHQVQAIFSSSDFYSDLQGEADHRIANSLSLISSLVRLRARAAATQVDPATFLMEIADRIETVGKLHRMIAHSPSEKLTLGAFLTEICARLGGAVASKETSFAIDCACKREFAAGEILPFGLVTAELFSNSLKYAHPAGTPVKIKIACEDTPAGLCYVYEDDGVGFPENFDLAATGNLGVRFIQLLCQKLEAAPQWSSDDLGMRFEMIASTSSDAQHR